MVNHLYIWLTIDIYKNNRKCQEEIDMTRHSLLTIANKLKGISISELARENDIPQSNLSKWFHEKKGGYVKKEKIEKMAKYLGVDFKNSKLLPGIHRWYFYYKDPKIFIEPLNSVLPAGGEILPIRFCLNPASLYETEGKVYSVAGEYRFYFVAVPHDHSCRILIEFDFDLTDDFMLLVTAELRNTNWKIGKPKKFEADEKKIIDRLEKITSIPEFDTILGSNYSSWTWERLISVLKEHGKVPAEVAEELGLVERENK